MSEAVIEELICSGCGSEALGKALFCYRCGTPLREKETDEAPVPMPDTEGDLSGAEAAGGLSEAKTGSAATEPDLTTDGESGGNVEERSDADGAAEDLRMRSASALMRRGPALRMKRIETRWEDADGAPNFWFILAAPALALIAFCVFLISMYLR